MSLRALLRAGELSHELYAAMESASHDEITNALALATDESEDVRAFLALTAVHLARDAESADRVLAAVVALSADADVHVRDFACCALANWRDLDTEKLREALAERLDDETDPRCEALVGLAYRRDPRALPRVRAALSRASGEVWWLEMVAAGALSDPALHGLVLANQDGWDAGSTGQGPSLKNPARARA